VHFSLNPRSKRRSAHPIRAINQKFTPNEMIQVLRKLGIAQALRIYWHLLENEKDCAINIATG
jgi:hypothetical protein